MRGLEVGREMFCSYHDYYVWLRTSRLWRNNWVTCIHQPIHLKNLRAINKGCALYSLFPSCEIQGTTQTHTLTHGLLKARIVELQDWTGHHALLSIETLFHIKKIFYFKEIDGHYISTRIFYFNEIDGHYILTWYFYHDRLEPTLLIIQPHIGWLLTGTVFRQDRSMFSIFHPNTCYLGQCSQYSTLIIQQLWFSRTGLTKFWTRDPLSLKPLTRQKNRSGQGCEHICPSCHVHVMAALITSEGLATHWFMFGSDGSLLLWNYHLVSH